MNDSTDHPEPSDPDPAPGAAGSTPTGTWWTAAPTGQTGPVPPADAAPTAPMPVTGPPRGHHDPRGQAPTPGAPPAAGAWYGVPWGDTPPPPPPGGNPAAPPPPGGPQSPIGGFGNAPGYAWTPWPPPVPPAGPGSAHRTTRRVLSRAGVAWAVAAVLLMTVAGLSAALASRTTGTGPGPSAAGGAVTPTTPGTLVPGSGSSGPGNTGDTGNTGSGGNTGNTGSTGSTGAVPGTGGASASANTAAIAAAVDPALVDIGTTLAQGGGAAGTGMVLTASGLVLTNNHVIEDASTISAQVDGTGRTYSATVVGYSVTDDVALIQLSGASGLATVTTGNPSSLRVGQPIVAIGNALGKGGTPSAVAGAVTALDRTITASDPGTLTETLNGLIEVNAPIQPGDSGGPVVDSAGQVVGMDTAASVSGGNQFGVQSGTGQGYAIAIDDALNLVRQIEAGQTSTTVHIGPRGLLGVEVSDSAPDGSVAVSGAYVDQVEAGSPAAAAGITPGDTVVSVNGTTVSSSSDLTDLLANAAPGATEIVGWTDAAGSSHSATVQLVNGPPA